MGCCVACVSCVIIFIATIFIICAFLSKGHNSFGNQDDENQMIKFEMQSMNITSSSNDHHITADLNLTFSVIDPSHHQVFAKSKSVDELFLNYERKSYVASVENPYPISKHSTNNSTGSITITAQLEDIGVANYVIPRDLLLINRGSNEFATIISLLVDYSYYYDGNQSASSKLSVAIVCQGTFVRQPVTEIDNIISGPTPCSSH